MEPTLVVLKDAKEHFLMSVFFPNPMNHYSNKLTRDQSISFRVGSETHPPALQEDVGFITIPILELRDQTIRYRH